MVAPFLPQVLPPDPFAPPMGGMPPDPMDAPMADALAAIMQPPPPPTMGPKRNPDDTPADKPKLAYILAAAEEEKSFHDERLKDALEMGEWLDQRRQGAFQEDALGLIDGTITGFKSNILRADHEYTKGVLAGMDVYYALAFRDVTETAEALTIEDAAYYWRAQEMEQYVRGSGGSLRYMEPDYLLRYGCLVGLDTVDGANAKCGLAMSLIDPLTVFPVWEGRRGLSEVFRVYEDTASNVIGNYGGAGKEYKRIEKKVNKIAGKDASGRTNRGTTHTITECWNTEWMVLVVDGEEVLSRRHGYGENPFTIILGHFDMPVGSSLASVGSAYAMNTQWGEISITDRSTDLARQYASFWKRKLLGHAMNEAVRTRNLSAYINAANPTWIYELEPMSADEDNAEVKISPGHVIRVPLGNRLSTMPTAPGAEIVAPLEAALAQNAEQGPWSQINAGGIPPQTSDSAIGTMMELGGAAQGILVDALEQFHRLRGQARCRRWRDWGPGLGAEGSYGEVPIPSQDGYASTPSHLLTPEVLDRAGCELNVTLFHPRPNPALINYLSSAQSAGFISRTTARRLMKAVPDPDREAYRIEDEMIDELPAIATQRALRRLDREAAAEIAAGDDENADAIMTAALELDFERQKQLAGGQAAPPPVGTMPGMPPGGQAVGPPGQPVAETPLPGSPPINQQGLSMVNLGVGVGQQGGRPTGSTQSREPTRSTTATAPKNRR